MLFDLNKNFKDDKGEDVIGPDGNCLNISGMLSSLLLSAVGKGNHCDKIWGWCISLGNSKTLELDEPDRNLMQEIIVSHPNLQIFHQAQMKIAFDKDNAVYTLKCGPDESKKDKVTNN